MNSGEVGPPAKKKKFNKIAAVLEEATAAAEAAEAERRKAKKAAQAAAKAAKATEAKKAAAAAAGVTVVEDAGDSGEAMPYRRTATNGWRPTKADWMAYVQKWKYLTDDLTGRKVRRPRRRARWTTRRAA